MNTDPWNDSAFPSEENQHSFDNGGLTKRDYLFNSVMTGLSANPKHSDLAPSALVDLAKQYVDAACKKSSP